jgi:dipeptidyl-peptidase 4
MADLAHWEFMMKVCSVPFHSLVARTALGCLAALCVFPLMAAKKPVTIADMMSQQRSFAPSPLWRPDGSAFAYREHGKVFLYDAATAQAKEWFDLTALEQATKKPITAPQPYNWQNRRVSETSMQWFPNGKDVLVSAGGDLFIVHPDGKNDKITPAGSENEDPKISPDGSSILYRHDFNLYVLKISDRKVKQLTSDGTPTLMNGKLDWVYPEELDLGTASWWSPDSKFVAYFQFNVSKEFMYPQADLLGERAVAEPERYPQAGTANAQVKLGAVSATGGRTTWMALGDTDYSLLARVNWLPDSDTLAVQRLTRVQDQLELLFVNRTTGAARGVIAEKSKTWINVSDDTHFFRNKSEFLWSSEATGFRHLYLYSYNGTLIRQVTSGDWEVRRVVAVDETKREVYFTSSQESPLEDHLYSVSLDGGQPQRLTKEPGTHSINGNEQGSFYMDTWSNVTNPPQTTLHDATGKQIAVFRAADRKVADEYAMQPTEFVKVTAPDGTLLYAKLIKPAGFEPSKKYPVVVFIYGGPHAQSVRDGWSGITWEQVLAHQGYVIWQLDNRGSSGRGHQFEEPLYRELGRVELSDQRVGVNKLISMGFVDPKRIGIFGWSYGGFMTLYSLLHAPDVFKAGIAGAPVTDFHNYDTIYTERYLGLPGENKAGYDKSSNVLAADKLQGKLLIIHNFEDDNVLFQNSLQMTNALQKADKQFDFMLFPQKSHGVGGPVRKTMYEGMTDFFNKNLKGE